MSSHVSLDLRQIKNASANLKRKPCSTVIESGQPPKKQRLEDSGAGAPSLPVAAFDPAIPPALFQLLQRACTDELEQWYNPSEPPVRIFSKEQLVKRRQGTSACCALPAHLMESAAEAVWVSFCLHSLVSQSYCQL